MLPQKYRIPSTTIRDVMRGGRRTIGNGITLIFCDRQQETGNKHQSEVSYPLSPIISCPRFSFIVSTKVDKRAIVRNRMRRVMSESIRRNISILHSSVDCVVFGSKILVGLSQGDVETRMFDVLHKAHLLNNESKIMNNGTQDAKNK